MRAAVDDTAPRDFDGMDAATMLWIVEGGFGPLLSWLTPAGSRLTAAPTWPDVMGAQLTARVQCEARLQALEQVLDVCAGRVPPPTLLKGVSLCTEQYAAPHLRPMGDIDVLVDVEWMADVERLVRELGYRAVGSPARYHDHHHVAPLVHPHTDVWIELHHGLFPARTDLAADAVFSPHAVRAERRPSFFRGRPVNHLSTELQVIYLPAHWAQNPQLLVGARGLRPLLDIMLLLRSASTLRWPEMLAWLDGAAAASQVYLMLAYLDALSLVTLPQGVLDGIRRRQRSFGPRSLRIAFELLDRYVVDGHRPGRIIGYRTLATIWRALLERGGWRQKGRVVSSILLGKAARMSWPRGRTPPGPLRRNRRIPRP